MSTIRPAGPLDVIRWPDGTWCYRGELNWADYSHMSDDYEVLTPENPEYELITGATA